MGKVALRDYNYCMKLKMVKVYLPSFAVCTLSLTVNLFVLGIYPLRAIAQETVLQTSNKQNKQQIDADDSASVEPEILAEINRVRTNPQGYAHWLEDQKQYYDNIWLRLPGEKPIRAHRLEKAIDEAIAALKEQTPLPALSTSEQTSATASEKLEDFATASRNIQNISYGRTTAKGIVMSLVVDELFPDRRRRKKLLSPNAEDTGVVCQNDPRYAKICAIAYSYPEIEDTVDQQPENSSPETETIARQQTKPPVEDKDTNSISQEPKIPEPDAELDTATENNNTPEDNATENTTPENTDVALETLPEPPAMPELPSTPKPPETDLPEPEIEDSATEVEDEEKETATTDTESETTESEETAQDEDDTDDVADKEEDVEEVFEAEEAEETEEKVAINSDSSRLLENVERGTLEEGDRIIAEDGSFYDSYPLEAESGESFTIALESDEFDAFVALIDAKGNIIEQNDDISEEDSNSRIRVTIPENGVYNVIVNAYDEGGSGQYILTISR